MAPGAEDAGVAAEYLVSGIAGDTGEGVVDLDNVAIGIGDNDTFTGVAEYACCELELCVGLTPDIQTIQKGIEPAREIADLVIAARRQRQQFGIGQVA